MSARPNELEAIARICTRLSEGRKPNPADVRAVFVGRLADKVRIGGTMGATIGWVIEDMQRVYGLSASTTRTLCQRHITHLMASTHSPATAAAMELIEVER